jgi:hypothetical protein
LLNTLVNPNGVPISPRTYAVHGIRDEDLVHAPTWDKVLPKLRKVTKDRTILAYNAEFDRSIILGDTARAGRKPMHLADTSVWGCLMNRRAPGDGYAWAVATEHWATATRPETCWSTSPAYPNSARPDQPGRVSPRRLLVHRRAGVQVVEQRRRTSGAALGPVGSAEQPQDQDANAECEHHPPHALGCGSERCPALGQRRSRDRAGHRDPQGRAGLPAGGGQRSGDTSHRARHPGQGGDGDRWVTSADRGAEQRIQGQHHR